MSEEIAPVEATPDVPEAPATPAPPAPKAAPLPLSERLQRAEGAIQRHKDTSKKLFEELSSTKAEREALAKEREEAKQQLAKYEAIKAALAEGDEDALRELGSDLDRFVQRRLDPEGMRAGREAKKGLSQAEKELQELKAWKEQQEQAAQSATFEREVRALVETAKAARDELPELAALDDDTVVELGQALAPQLYKQLGRYPTFREIVAKVNEAVAPYHERIIKAYLDRETKKAPPPAPPLKKGSPPPAPSTITNRSASQAAGKPSTMTDEERRKKAIAVAQQLMNPEGG